MVLPEITESTIQIKNKEYKIEYSGTNSRYPLRANFMFHVIEKKAVSCWFNVSFCGTSIAIWKNNSKYVKNDPASIIRFLITLLPHINIGIPEYEMRYHAHTPSFEINFDYDYPDVFNPENKKLYINPKNSPEEVVEKYVYEDDQTDNKVEKEMLKKLFYILRHGNNPYSIEELENSMFIDKQSFNYSLTSLIDAGYVKIFQTSLHPTLTVISMTPIGRAYYLNKHINNLPQIHPMVQITGPIHNSQIGGMSNIQNNIYNIDTINVAFDEAKAVIEKEYTGGDKIEIIQKLERTQKLAMKKENAHEVRRNLGEILANVSNFVTIATAIVKIMGMFILPVI